MPRIRFAALEDIPDVVALWSRAAGPTRHAGGLTEVRQLLRHDPESLLVAEEEDRIVGTVIAGWDGWRLHLYRLAVAPAARRSGVATALVAGARKRASSLGAVRLDAMVDVENAGAAAFWEDAGFELDARERRWSLRV
ncbi:MAG: GNAT family N-acetyltransferase [Acidimicrobiales bacterium]